MWAVSGGLCGYIGVGGGGVIVGRGTGGDWACLVYLGNGFAFVGVLRPCVVGAGIHALHWNILSWLKLKCSHLLHGLGLWRAGRAVNGGCMLGFCGGRLHGLCTVVF